MGHIFISSGICVNFYKKKIKLKLKLLLNLFASRCCENTDVALQEGWYCLDQYC